MDGREKGTDFYPITNRHVFNEVFSQERFARPLLEAVMGRAIGAIKVIHSEHTIEPSLRGRGVRMDVMYEDDVHDAYDLEMQRKEEPSIALRGRYLLSSFDRNRIVRGEDYAELRATTVIFVCEHDPIGLGFARYTYRMRCDESGEELGDGNLLILLNAQGAAKAAGPKTDDRVLRFLAYVDGGGTMGDEWLDAIDRAVYEINADEGWRNGMLGYEMDMMDARRVGRREGREESERLYRELAAALVAAGREGELAGAMLDPGRLDALAEELGVGRR